MAVSDKNRVVLLRRFQEFDEGFQDFTPASTSYFSEILCFAIIWGRFPIDSRLFNYRFLHFLCCVGPCDELQETAETAYAVH